MPLPENDMMIRPIHFIPAVAAAVLACASAFAADPVVIPHENELTNHIRTIPFEKVCETEDQDGFALFSPTRITSPIAPVVVREDDPKGARYQEALGYTFLINAAKFPAMTRMDNGRIILT